MGSELTSRCRGRFAARGNAAAGFTLIELVVVVAVLSILAVGAGLVASRSGNSSAESDAQRFERHVETVRARAIQGRQAQGLFITAQGFQSAVFGADGWVKQPRETRWRAGATLQLRDARAGANAPHVVLLPDGRLSDFSLVFSQGGQGRVVCRSDQSVGVICG